MPSDQIHDKKEKKLLKPRNTADKEVLKSNIYGRKHIYDKYIEDIKE